MKISKSFLEDFFTYHPKTGKFVRYASLSWKGNRYLHDPRPIKSITPYGYLQCHIEGRPYHVHRLIFVMMTDKFPESDVDHINGIRTDNRWINLRLVTRQENLQNQGVRSDNTSGFIGVSLRRDTGKYDAYINVNGSRLRLGTYNTVDDAVAARRVAELKHGFHPNHGRRAAWSE